MKLANEIINLVEAKDIFGVGKIVKTQSPELDLAFIQNPGMKEKIAVTPNTKLKHVKKFKDLKVGDLVRYTAKKTDRGFEAITVDNAMQGF